MDVLEKIIAKQKNEYMKLLIVGAGGNDQFVKEIVKEDGLLLE